LTSRVVVIDDYIVWAVGEMPQPQRNAAHQSNRETAAQI